MLLNPLLTRMWGNKHSLTKLMRFFSVFFSYPFIESFKIFIYFYWRIIAFQHCVGFYQTSAWINHRFTHVLSHLKSLPPPPFHPSRLLSRPGLSSLSHAANSHWRSMHTAVYVSMLLSPYLLPFPSSSPSTTNCDHKSVLNVCVSIAALQIGSSVPSI